jgi:small subunit ribosomal protein S21
LPQSFCDNPRKALNSEVNRLANGRGFMYGHDHTPANALVCGHFVLLDLAFCALTALSPNGEIPLVQIFVRDNNVDQALKALKKKMQREGSFREMKRHVHYEKPSEKRARQQAEAVRRARKLARKRIQREGGGPPVKPKV